MLLAIIFIYLLKYFVIGAVIGAIVAIIVSVCKKVSNKSTKTIKNIQSQEFSVDNVSEWYCPECDYKNKSGHICKSCGYEAKVIIKPKHITEYSAEALGVMAKPIAEKNEIDITSNQNIQNRGFVHSSAALFNDDTMAKLNKKYIAFDVETTGLNSYIDRIIEIGAVIFENQIPIKEFGTLVNPKIKIPSAATAVNHITNDMIATAPNEKEVYADLVKFLGDALKEETIICAHNAKFDMGFLSETLMRLGYNADIIYVDTLSISRRMVFGIENYKQPTLASHFGIVNEQEHRAVSDAKTCGYILLNLLNLQQEKQKELLIKKEHQAEAERLKQEELQKIRNDYIEKREKISINPIHNRVSLNDIVDSKDGFYKGYEYWYTGDNLRKNGNIEDAIKMFDKARYNGYNAPALYLSYARAYRQLKDYENEIDILDEAITRNLISEDFESRRYKALCLFIKQQDKILKEQEKMQKKIEKQEQKEVAKNIPKKIQGKAVLQLSDDLTIIKRYDTIAEASRETGINASCISDTAKGIQKHAGRFIWKYADEIQSNETTPAP